MLRRTPKLRVGGLAILRNVPGGRLFVISHAERLTARRSAAATAGEIVAPTKMKQRLTSAAAAELDRARTYGPAATSARVTHNLAWYSRCDINTEPNPT